FSRDWSSDVCSSDLGSVRALARDRARRRLLKDLAIGKAGARIEVAIGRLAFHPVEGKVQRHEVLLVVAGDEKQEERGRDEPSHRSASFRGRRPKSLTESAPLARRMFSASIRSNRGSVASTARKKRSEVTRENCGTSSTGAQSLGSREKPRKESRAPKAASSTVPSKV